MSSLTFLLASIIISHNCAINLSQNYGQNLPMGIQAELAFKVDGDEIFFFVKKNGPGYLAFGIGRSMASADIVSITKTSNGSIVSITDCKLVGMTFPKCSGSSENWKWAKSQSESSESNSLSMKVELRKAIKYPQYSKNQNDQAGRLEINNGKNYIIYSYSNSEKLAKHDGTGDNDVKILYIDLGTTSSGSERVLDSIAKFCLVWIAVGICFGLL